MERSRTIERIGGPALFSKVTFAMPRRVSASPCEFSGWEKSIYLLKPVEGQETTVDGPGSLNKLALLPFELLSRILEEYLDLDSMMCVASTDTTLRELVSSLSLVKRMRESKELALPLILLRNAQTAKFHTLRDFKSSLQTITCHVCGIKSQFGTLVNLLTLRRVCYLCVSKSHFCLPVPTDLVKSMFGLDETCLRNSGITSARAISTHIRRIPSPTSQFGYDVEIFHTFETVHNLQDVIDAAASEYSKPGKPGILGLKSHMENFLDSYLWPGSHMYYSTNDGVNIHLTENVSVTGVIRAIEASWKGRAEDARYAIVTPMPHLRMLDTLELGLTCQGCLQDRFHRSNQEDVVRKANTSFLQEQLLGHIETCESAQMILRGERLRRDEEDDEIFKSGLRGRMDEFWDPFKNVKVPPHIREAVHDLEFGIDRAPDQYRLRCAQVRDMIEQANPERGKELRKRRESPKQAHKGNTCRVRAPRKKRKTTGRKR